MPLYSGMPQEPPSRLRWMQFVDGENFTVRAQETLKSSAARLVEGELAKKDVFAWFKGRPARSPLYEPPASLSLQRFAVRSYYYASVVGSPEDREKVHEALHHLGFSPEVFRKDKNGRSKGVDISLTKDMLGHAHRDHYDVAVLVSGDGDYLPVVEEVKRLGKIVYVFAFESGLSKSLKLAADAFCSLDGFISNFETVPAT